MLWLKDVFQNFSCMIPDHSAPVAHPVDSEADKCKSSLNVITLLYLFDLINKYCNTKCVGGTFRGELGLVDGVFVMQEV